MRDLSFDRCTLYLTQKTKERDFVFLLTFGTEEDAGLCVVASHYPINILYGFPASTLKLLWGQGARGIVLPVLISLRRAATPVHRVTRTSFLRNISLGSPVHSFVVRLNYLL